MDHRAQPPTSVATTFWCRPAGGPSALPCAWPRSLPDQRPRPTTLLVPCTASGISARRTHRDSPHLRQSTRYVARWRLLRAMLIARTPYVLCRNTTTAAAAVSAAPRLCALLASSFRCCPEQLQAGPRVAGGTLPVQTRTPHHTRRWGSKPMAVATGS